MMFRRLCTTLIVGTLGAGAFSSQTVFAEAAQYPVVAVGDSILAYMHPTLWPDGWHLDAQGSRNPYDAPETTVDGSVPTSTVDAVAENIPLVAPGGVFIFQDAAGAFVDAAGWADLINDVVDQLPDDRCLVVITGYVPDDGVGGMFGPQADQNVALVELSAAQPCHAVVPWDVAVAMDAHAMLDPDGIHPSLAGNAWLAAMLKMTVEDLTT